MTCNSKCCHCGDSNLEILAWSHKKDSISQITGTCKSCMHILFTICSKSQKDFNKYFDEYSKNKRITDYDYEKRKLSICPQCDYRECQLEKIDGMPARHYNYVCSKCSYWWYVYIHGVY